MPINKHATEITQNIKTKRQLYNLNKITHFSTDQCKPWHGDKNVLLLRDVNFRGCEKWGTPQPYVTRKYACICQMQI